MQFLAENWFVILTALISGGMLLAPMLSGAGAASVVASEAVTLINREKAVVIDVSEPAEYAASHIAGAKHQPMAGLAESKQLPANKATPLVLTCPTGARSKRAVAILRKSGFERVYALAGGTHAWREAHLPIEAETAKGST